MARINLLPWREELRQEKKKEFLTQLAGVFILAALVGFVWVQTVEGRVDAQNQRNNRLNSEIKRLDAQVKEIKDLKKKRKELMDRMKVIQDLEGRRSIIVHYFDEFVRATPDGIFVNSVARKGNSIEIRGVGESNNRISSFMRQLDDSDWFANPDLKTVVAKTIDSENVYEFTMSLKAVVPGDQVAEDK